MTAEEAAGIGEDALIWLAGRPEEMGRLLAASGLVPEALRRRAAEPEFLGFVLEFLLGDEAMVIGFAAEAGISPDAPARARAALPGGALPHWT